MVSQTVSKSSLLRLFLRRLAIHGGAAVAVCYLLGLWWQRRRFCRNVQYVKGQPLVGIALDIVRSLFKYRLHDLLASWHEQKGKTLAGNMGGVCIVCTYDPKNLEHILRDNFDNYIKGDIFSVPYTDLLGDGIFNVDGDKWYHQRKTASRMFTKKNFETHIQDAVQANIRKVSDLLMKSSGEVVDFFNVMNRFTLDTIGEIGFSRNIGSLADPSSPFLKSFDYVQSALAKRSLTSQSFPTFKLLRKLNLFWERDLPAHLNLLNDYSNSIVEDLIQKVADGADNSFVGLFAKDEEGQEFMQRDPAGFRVYMRDMVLNFLIAGRDTTAQTLTWTVLELAQYPAVVAKIREEVEEVCGDSAITYQDINKLPYVRAVIDEGGRLHPSVPLDGKQTVHDDVLPDGTIVKAGTRMLYLAYAQGRDKELWGADALSFRPERWLEMQRRPTPYEFVGFNAGKRECLGRRLAELEMVTLVATLMRDFDVQLKIAPAEVQYDIQLTLGCYSGLPVIVTPRRDASLSSAQAGA